MNYSEEEKKAIEYIERQRRGIPPNGRFIINNTDINTVLNLIETQKAEIEKLEKQSKNLDKEAQAYLEELVGDNGFKNRTIAQLQAEIEKLQFHLQAEQQQREYDVKEIDKLKGECVKKNKQIELMAEKIYELGINYRNKEQVIEYFTKLAEENKL